MRKCPIKTCSCKIDERMYVCSYHWRKFPRQVKNFIAEIFRQYMAEEISITELRQMHVQILADFQGISFDEASEPQLTAAVKKCRYCGVVTICGMVEDPGGASVIIGGKKMLALDQPAIFTRFSMHACEGLKKSLAKVRCGNGQTPRLPLRDGDSLRHDARAG